MSQKLSTFLSVFLGYLRSIFSHIQEVYRNFFHWNLSKIVISVVSFIIGILFSSPFLVVLVILMSVDSIDWLSLSNGILSGQALWFEVISQFLSAPFFLAFEFLLAIVALGFFVAGYNYTWFLSARLYLGYQEQKKLPILRKDYFNIRLVWKFLQIFFLQWLFISIAFGGLLVVAILLFIIFQLWFLSFDILSYTLLFFLVLSVIAGFYIGYRVYFAVFLFADSCDVNVAAKDYIKKSVLLTNGKNIFLFLLLFVVFHFILSPIYLLWDTLSVQEIQAKDYLSYKTTPGELPAEDQIYYEYLQEKYTDATDDQVINSIMIWNTFGFFFSLAVFLFIEGLFYVVSIWFYKEILLKWKKSHTTSLFSKWWKKWEL